MSIELWENRIISSLEKPKRFLFFNPETNGLGAWIEFTTIVNSEMNGAAKIQKQVNFKLDGGEGHLWITDSDGEIRDPFYDRTWFYGSLKKKDTECTVRFRFIDEASGGAELGTRVYTHWRYGAWKLFPAQDRSGKLLAPDAAISFGWSVNGNAYFWEPKPAESAEEDVKKAPKAFVKAVPSEAKPLEVTAEPAPVKKPKMFVPKTKPTDLPPV
jgi:hypothetical protein